MRKTSRETAKAERKQSSKLKQFEEELFMATINTVVENLTLSFDMVYSKVVYEGSKDELFDRIEDGNCLIRFVYEGPDRKLHELITRSDNVISLEFPVEGAGVPVGVKPSPKKLDEKADNLIPFPIRKLMEQAQENLKLNDERAQSGPRIIVATPEEFMSHTGMSEEDFIRMISSTEPFRKM
jgi:hypothetical protein